MECGNRVGKAFEVVSDKVLQAFDVALSKQGIKRERERGGGGRREIKQHKIAVFD